MQDGAPPPEARDGAHAEADLRSRLTAAGSLLGAREANHQTGLDEARKRCDALRVLVTDAIDSFHAAAADAGAPHLRVDVSPVRLDEKHVRAIEFEVRRGRHAAIVTVKSRGDVTLVGPFRTGKTEGPCRTFPWDAKDDICKALGDFLVAFLEEAATP
jgi:hypothetical protein